MVGRIAPGGNIRVLRRSDAALRCRHIDAVSRDGCFAGIPYLDSSLRPHTQALYDLCPPKVTSLYAVKVPGGERQVCRYDDTTGDELEVPLGTTACEWENLVSKAEAPLTGKPAVVDGAVMFDILPKALKSLAVRSRVRYVSMPPHTHWCLHHSSPCIQTQAPHPYVWMSRAKARSTGLGIENDGLELALDDLPEWSDDKVKALPVCWKNPATGRLHLQVHPCGAQALLVDPLPEGAERGGALYPDGGVVEDLETVRELLYRMQRPGIAPEVGTIVGSPCAPPHTLPRRHSSSTRSIGRKRTSRCFTTAASCTASSARSPRTK